MKKLATIVTLMLLALGPASVWADVIHGACPPEHGDMAMEMHECCAKNCCMSAAPIPSGHSSTAPLRVKIAGAITLFHPPSDLCPDARTPEAPRAHGASPAASQTTPVLRR